MLCGKGLHSSEIADLDGGEPRWVQLLSDHAMVQATLDRTEQFVDELELRLPEQCSRV